MANADFSQKQNSTSGGFDAGSYREQKQPEQAVPLTWLRLPSRRSRANNG